MSFTLNLPPEIEERFRDRAERFGAPLNLYVGMMLADLCDLPKEGVELQLNALTVERQLNVLTLEYEHEHVEREDVVNDAVRKMQEDRLHRRNEVLKARARRLLPLSALRFLDYIDLFAAPERGIGEESMSPTLEFDREAEEKLRAEAERRGLSLEDYLLQVIEAMDRLMELTTSPRLENTPPETPNIIEEALIETVRSLKERQIAQRELAVHIISGKNNLQAERDRLIHIIEQLEGKSVHAYRQGNRELAKAFYKEKRLQEQGLEMLRPMLEKAEETTKQVKQNIKQEEERIRVATTRAMVLKMQMTAEILSFNQALYMGSSEMSALQDVEADFERWISGNA